MIEGIMNRLITTLRKRVSASVLLKANQNPAMHRIEVEIKVEFLGTDCSYFLVMSSELIHGTSCDTPPLISKNCLQL